MRNETVETYSDATNAAIMRHPGRRFPGVLIQGDTLSTYCYRLDDVCKKVVGLVDEDAALELNDIRNALWSLLTHYKAVLGEHGIPLPFSDRGPA